MKRLIRGFLSKHSDGEGENILFVSTIHDPLAEYLKEEIANKNVSIRYWISKEEVSREDVEIEFMKELEGVADCDWGHYYSDYTGYLWTDEACKVGGHNLIDELKTHVGKYINLDIEIHEAR